MNRYFATSEAAYAQARAALDAALGYPMEHTSSAGTVVRTDSSLMPWAALPKTQDGRGLVAFSPGDLISPAAQVALTQAAQNSAVQELTQAEYLALLPPPLALPTP